MRGWKTVERTIPGPVLIDLAVSRVTDLGFAVHARQPGHVVLHRAGTQKTARGERFPLELTIAEAEDGLFLRLRYDTFVLFDTGDLERLADDLADAMAGAAT